MRDERLERAQWLNLARRQAREISEAREEQPQPFRWPTVAEPGERRAPRLLGMPLAWGVAAVTVVLLCGVTGTYAYVRHLQQEQRRSVGHAVVAPVVEKAPAAPAASLKGTSKAVAAPIALPNPPPSTPRQRRKRREPRTSAAVPAPVTAPAPLQPRGEVTFSPEDMPGGGELILVSPPPRMGPLWSPEEYRKNGRLGSRP